MEVEEVVKNKTRHYEMLLSDAYSNVDETRYNLAVDKNIFRDFMDLGVDGIEGVIAVPVYLNNLYFWDVLFQGKKGSVFNDGYFEALIVLPYNYPQKPPAVTFSTQMFHPFISSYGILDFESIRTVTKNGEDESKYNLRWALLKVQNILSFPMTSCVLKAGCSFTNPVAGNLLDENPCAYMKQAKELMLQNLKRKESKDIPRVEPISNAKLTEQIRKHQVEDNTFCEKERKLAEASEIPAVEKIQAPTKANAKRLMNDLKSMEDAPVGITGVLSNDNIYNWDVTLLSPEGIPIEASLHFGEKYPFTPPTMIFKKKIFHPNVDLKGVVCIEAQDWTPVQTVWSILASVQCLLSEPNLSSPANTLAAQIFRNDQQSYNVYATESLHQE